MILQGLLNGTHIANSVMMLKSTNKNKTFLLVEGKTDSLGYGWLIDKLSCAICAGNNKDNVMDAINILENKRILGVLGVVDSDFWSLKHFVPPSSNILMTDTHDIETLVMNSPALHKLLHFYGDSEKVEKINIVSLLLNAAKPIGLLRFLSLEKNLNLNFKNLNFQKFINKSTLQTDNQELVKAVITNTKKCKIPEKKLNEFLDRQINRSYDLWQVCCGHDLVNILAIALQEVVGSYQFPPSERKITEWLLLAYESIHLSQTNLYKSILQWEKNNKPYIVLSSNYRFVSDPVLSNL
jgi:Protein of unknown function (DUF4435)